jgi:hypothetical protein
MNEPVSATDPSRCPLCGTANQCANEVEKATGMAQPPCWCTSATFTPALLARIPPEARRVACVCAACAVRFSAHDATQ